ncbi:MAG: hypothetical protein WBV82_18790 [Myxococcaceae bacterium]
MYRLVGRKRVADPGPSRHVTVGLLAKNADLPNNDKRLVQRLGAMIQRITDELDAHFIDREEEASAEATLGP